MKQVLLVLAASFLIFGGCTSKNNLEIAKEDKPYNGYVHRVYSNKNIGVYFQYSSDWNIFDDQDIIKNSELSFLSMEQEDVFLLLITPSKKIPSKYEFEGLKYPIVLLVAIQLPARRRELPNNFLQDAINYKISVMKKEDNTTSIIDGPRDIDINGKEWITFSAEMKRENGFIKNYSYVDEEGKWYEYSAACKLNKMKEYTHYFDQIIGSMKLVKIN